ncbi:MAG: hypothetical protein IPH13_03885 [Planctomycetes bacterium]|nr:hypothetical protein [Planctomycetota bacterium]
MAWGTAWIGVAVGLVAGAAGGVWFAQSEPASAVRLDDSIGEPTREASDASSSRNLAPASTSGVTESAPDAPKRLATGDGLFSSELLQFARDEIDAGWRETRTDPVPAETMTAVVDDFRARTLDLPRSLGRDAAERATHAEALERALTTKDGLLFLRTIQKTRQGPFVELVDDATTFPSFFEARIGGGVLDGTALPQFTRDTKLSGVTIQFPAGVFEPRCRFDDVKAPVTDVAIAGAGMDQTLLVMQSVSFRVALERITIRDCTVFVPSGCVFDLRTEPALIRLERVRIVGYDCGAGGSCAFATAATMMWLSDCQILDRFGHHPGGRIFDLRTDGVLIRLDRCRIENTEFGDVPSGSTVLFNSCTLRGARRFPEAEDGIEYRGCSIEKATTNEDPPARSLNELFPDWEKRRIRQ